MHIDVLIGMCEKRVERIVKASRIYPELVNRASRPLSRLRLLKALREVVEEVEVELPNGCKRIWHPYPPEAVSLIRKLREAVEKNGLRVSFFNVWLNNEKAYVSVRDEETGYTVYAVTCSSGQPDFLGEPDMDWRGLRIYSVDKIREYFERCIKYVESLYPNTNYHRDAVREVQSITESLGKYVGVVRLSYDQLRYFKGYEIVVEPELIDRGVRVVEELKIDYDFTWMTRKDGCYLYGILPEGEAEKILSEYGMVEKKSSKWRKLIRDPEKEEKIKVSVEEVLRILREESPSIDLDKLSGVVEKYCGDVYLLRASSYRIVPPSPDIPLGILYLSRILRKHGLAGTMVRMKGKKGRGDKYVLLAANICCVDWVFYSLAAKPRKDLKIEYPCDAKLEDGCIVIVDRESLGLLDA
jgi:hypothetical protein